MKVQQVAEDLGVSYVLEGSVQKSAQGVRITAQLIDARSGDHIWANRYEEEGEDVTALQENVATKIYESVAGLRGEIRKEEERAAWQKSPPSLGEYDYYLRGHQPFFEFTPESNERARRIWQEGLAKYPDSALHQDQARLDLQGRYRQWLERRSEERPGNCVETGDGGSRQGKQVEVRDVPVPLADGAALSVSQWRFRTVGR